MARLARVCPVGIPQHIIQRGNNRQVCFAREQDFSAYLSWLKDYAKKYQVWVLMTNNVHVLCAPRVDNAVSRMLQSLGRDIMYDILMSAISERVRFGRCDLNLVLCK